MGCNGKQENAEDNYFAENTIANSANHDNIFNSDTLLIMIKCPGREDYHDKMPL